MSTNMAIPVSKYNRKVSRCLQMLIKKYPYIEISKNQKYKVIFLGNCGHTTGHDESNILSSLQSMSAHKGIVDITVLVGSQYSFVTYSNSEEAKAALKNIITCATAAHEITTRCYSDESVGVQNTSHENYSGSEDGVSKNISCIYAAIVSEVPRIMNSVQFTPPPDLQVIAEFINENEEQELLKLIRWDNDYISANLGSSLKHRQVRHFGYEFKYGSNTIDPGAPLIDAPIPPLLLHIINKMTSEGIVNSMPDQVTVNRYLAGQGIPPHIDSHSACTEELVSLSCGSAVVMDFTHDGEANNKDGDIPLARHHSVLLPARSLCVMRGQVRYCWQHGIKSRMTDVYMSGNSNAHSSLTLLHRAERVSFTFRKTRSSPCSCQYQQYCDSHKSTLKASESCASSTELNMTDPASLEAQHVQAVYEDIAHHFSDTRHKPWPNVEKFVRDLPEGSLLLDVGCGNGKYLGLNKSVFEVGSDMSSNLLHICRHRSHEAVLNSCLCLPFKDGTFDGVICIAVIHHLASQERREQAVREMVRVMRVGGRGLIYVWALEQKRRGVQSSYLKQKHRKGKQTEEENNEDQEEEVLGNNSSTSTDGPCGLPVHQNRTDFKDQDTLVPWKLKIKQTNPVESIHEDQNNAATSGDSQDKQVFLRYYHTFCEGELEELCGTIQQLSVANSYYDNGNWCVSFRKEALEESVIQTLPS